jgi:transposase InsO family protein
MHDQPPQGSQPEAVFLSAKAAASLIGVSAQAVRDNAAAGKYPGAHKTTGPGGEGWAIPLGALPAVAQAMYYHEQFTAAALTGDLLASGSSFTPEDREEHWKRYDEATEKCQARARAAFAAVMRFNELLREGIKKMDAYATIKAELDVARSTLNEWQQAVDGLDQSDWLPALTPDLSGRTNARRVEWPGPSWLHFLNGALTPGANVATAYKRTKREAEAQGWGDLPSLPTARNDLKFSIDHDVATLIKQGQTALKRLSPTVERDYEAFRLHELWSMDGRRMDLMVCDTKGEFGPKGRVFRMWLYGVMEVRSRYLVGYSLGPELNADAVRDALVNAFRKTNLIRPENVQVDNGMEAAAKEITGGASWRRRGKVKENEIIGLLPFLNVAVSWATPAHGQTKPVERLFGTLARMHETRSEFRGAYCGHKPEARPEEWDSTKADRVNRSLSPRPASWARHEWEKPDGDVYRVDERAGLRAEDDFTATTPALHAVCGPGHDSPGWFICDSRGALLLRGDRPPAEGSRLLRLLQPQRPVRAGHALHGQQDQGGGCAANRTDAGQLQGIREKGHESPARLHEGDQGTRQGAIRYSGRR